MSDDIESEDKPRPKITRKKKGFRGGDHNINRKGRPKGSTNKRKVDPEQIEDLMGKNALKAAQNVRDMLKDEKMPLAQMVKLCSWVVDRHDKMTVEKLKAKLKEIEKEEKEKPKPSEEKGKVRPLFSTKAVE